MTAHYLDSLLHHALGLHYRFSLSHYREVQDEGLSEGEHAELLAIVGEREEQNVEPMEAMGRLSELRGVPFQPL